MLRSFSIARRLKNIQDFPHGVRRQGQGFARPTIDDFQERRTP
jgi:hypothetical protein